MNRLKDKYQIQENSILFSFQPFHHYKKGIIKYVLFLLTLGFLIGYYFNTADEVYIIIGSTILLVYMLMFLKEILIYIPIQYTFDASKNAVFKKDLLGKREIMKLEEVVFFKSSEMGNWHYKMGAKRSQFVKNYSISEYFENSDKGRKKAIEFEHQILLKIQNKNNIHQMKSPSTYGNGIVP